MAKGKAGTFANLREAQAPGIDFEIGADVVLFDNLVSGGQVESFRCHVTMRRAINSDPPGQGALIVKYPVRAGFVPFGALRPDGSAHPHAGTGYHQSGDCVAHRGPQGFSPWHEYVPRAGRPTSICKFTSLRTTRQDLPGDKDRPFSTENLVPGWTILDGNDQRDSVERLSGRDDRREGSMRRH